jgi:hypothetical protein
MVETANSSEKATHSPTDTILDDLNDTKQSYATTDVEKAGGCSTSVKEAENTRESEKSANVDPRAQKPNYDDDGGWRGWLTVLGS